MSFWRYGKAFTPKINIDYWSYSIPSFSTLLYFCAKCGTWKVTAYSAKGFLAQYKSFQGKYFRSVNENLFHQRTETLVNVLAVNTWESDIKSLEGSVRPIANTNSLMIELIYHYCQKTVFAAPFLLLNTLFGYPLSKSFFCFTSATTVRTRNWQSIRPLSPSVIRLCRRIRRFPTLFSVPTYIWITWNSEKLIITTLLLISVNLSRSRCATYLREEIIFDMVYFNTFVILVSHFFNLL